jgi:hypothetical protein
MRVTRLSFESAVVHPVNAGSIIRLEVAALGSAPCLETICALKCSPRNAED